MHLRGKAMRYIAHYPDGNTQTLLYVPAYEFNWQITYQAQKPIFSFRRGPGWRVIGEFDNSVNNPRNPDPKAAVRWGAASENEMMDVVGWSTWIRRRI